MPARTEVTPLPNSRSFIPGLDGIRAIAVLTIFLFHAQIVKHIPGELATTTFFFLSGFLITTLFVKEWRKTGTISLSRFYYRRALRTLPPLFAALFISIGASALLHVGDPVTPWKGISSFFNFTNYALAFSGSEYGFLPGTVLLWSLAVDEHYNLLFAPTFKAAIKRVPMKAMIGGILFFCAAALVWRAWLIHAGGGMTYRESMASDTRMDSILWGALLALWRNPALDPSRARVLAKPIWVAAGIAGLLFVDLLGGLRLVQPIGYTIQGISLIPIFSLVILQGGKGRLKFLQAPWLMWVSRASYPLYLLQWIMITICEKYVPGPRIGEMAVAAVLTFGLGAAMHYGLEVPLAAMRKRSRRPELAPAPARMAA